MDKQTDRQDCEQNHSSENACSAGVLDWSKHRLRQWFDNQALIRGLDQWDSAELDRLLSESGLTRRGLNALLRGGDSSQPLMAQVMERFGVTEALSQQNFEVLRDVQRVCTTCPHKVQCRRLLKETEGSQPFRSFCLNAGTFEAFEESKNQ
ncbi:DUF6455 family protein [Marinobacter sp.]|uniref:DUF6455 family protein n=1 Tax=Marinobacter sp. TaxID=50741 RepID=UPI00384BFADE